VSVTLDHLLEPLQALWNEPGIEEICVQAPHVAWCWIGGKFERRDIAMDADDIEDLAHCAAAQWHKDVGRETPLLSCDLPGEGRLQVVLPPCVADGFPSITIRIGDEEWPTLDDYTNAGFFKKTRNKPRVRPAVDDELAALFIAEDYDAFLRLAVRSKKTIVGIGETASGKTRFSKALLGEVPLTERLITIEDAPELRNIPHPNHVSLYFDKEGRGITALQLTEAALRMRIGRLMLQEIRDGQAMIAFLAALLSGATGAITTLHARSPADAWDRMRVLIKGTPAGAAISDADITKNLQNNIDIILHFDRTGSDFSMSEAWFRPVSLGEA
jgi:type IV secretion system protein VirB11